MFFARSLSLRVSSYDASASTVIEVRPSGVQVVAVQAAVVERALGVADLLQVARGELVGVDDQRGAARQVGEVGLEGGRVHRDQDVRRVARGQHVVVGEVQLEAGDPGQRALRGADLGREVRQGRQVVAQDRGLGGEPVAGQLHAVAAVPGEPDDDPIERCTCLVLIAASTSSPRPQFPLPTPS